MMLPPRQLGLRLQSESWRYSRPMRSISSTITSTEIRASLPLRKIIPARAGRYKHGIWVAEWLSRAPPGERRLRQRLNFGFLILETEFDGLADIL